jgi:acetyl-CoA carboxylase biotin carboxyl carrier protein
VYHSVGAAEDGRESAMANRDVQSEITGRVWKIEARVGQAIGADETVMVLESMKMEIPVAAPIGGRLAEIRVAEGDLVEEGQVVATIEI